MEITDTLKCSIMMEVFEAMMYKVAVDTRNEWMNGSMVETLKDMDSKYRWDYYSFIPNATNKVVDQLIYTLTKLKEKEPNRSAFRFLDVGCGIGNIIMLAKYSGFRQAHGIEFDRSHENRFLYDKEDILNKQSEVQVFWQDAMKFTNYGAYDVVYMYRPIHDYAMQRKLERIVSGTMKKGAYLLANLCEKNWGRTKMEWVHAKNGVNTINDIWVKQ